MGLMGQIYGAILYKYTTVAQIYGAILYKYTTNYYCISHPPFKLKMGFDPH
jgi:hypothetical protein